MTHRTAEQVRARLKNGEALFGCFLSLGSNITAEIMGAAGYDWGLIDLEHGAGGERDVLVQAQALAAAGSFAIVRVESTERQRVHRVLDFGVHGVMFPRVDTPEEARRAVEAMRYPRHGGVRGVAFSNRASGYGTYFQEYLEHSTQLLTVVQIESEAAVNNAEAIAAIEGVDVLFVGPTDLSHTMGIPGQYENPVFLRHVEHVARAAAEAGKWSGILLPSVPELARYHGMGYRFLASGSDAVMLNNAAREHVGRLRTGLAQVARSGQ